MISDATNTNQFFRLLADFENRVGSNRVRPQFIVTCRDTNFTRGVLKYFWKSSYKHIFVFLAPMQANVSVTSPTQVGYLSPDAWVCKNKECVCIECNTSGVLALIFGCVHMRLPIVYYAVRMSTICADKIGKYVVRICCGHVEAYCTLKSKNKKLDFFF